MAALSGFFLSWNILVILTFIFLFGLSKFAENFTVGKYLVVFVIGIPILVVAFLLSPIPYILFKDLRADVRREHGSFWTAQKYQMRKSLKSLLNI